MSWAARCMEVLSLEEGVLGRAVLGRAVLGKTVLGRAVPSGNQGQDVVAGASSWTRQWSSRLAGAARCIVWEVGHRSSGLREGSGYHPWAGAGSDTVAVIPGVSAMYASHTED